MADSTRRLTSNVPGSFFVDESCIDCGTCRWMAPKTFDKSGEYSRVFCQPEVADDREAAYRALVACPTASIGGEDAVATRLAGASFPYRIEDEVYFCGFHSESSFGATSYFIRRAEGNILVDSPRYASRLVRRLEDMGGVSLMFLTHIDDVADHALYASHFGCTRVMHRGDYRERVRDIEWWIDDDEPVELASGVVAQPTPGHTAGSTCLHVDDRFLFSGDTLAWSRALGHIYAFRRACWYDWDTLIKSVERLGERSFEWLLPGHGSPRHLSRTSAKREIENCIRWMREQA